MLSQLLDNALAYDMVWQAAKGLCTYDVIDAAVDQLDHFTGQEPAFTGLIADRNDFLRIFYGLVDPAGRLKVDTLFKGFSGTAAQIFKAINAKP